MSRKSKLTMNVERLGRVSDCPSDIFNKLGDEDELFLDAERAMQGDGEAVKKLATLLFNTYVTDDEPNNATLYYLRQGISLGISECAVLMLRYIVRYNRFFEDLENAISIIEIKYSDEIKALIENAKLKKLIRSANLSAESLCELDELADVHKGYVHVYLAGVTKEYGDDMPSLLHSLGIPGVIRLPSFSPITSFPDYHPMDAKGECLTIIHALELVDMDEWSDFWLRLAYEYALEYLNGDLSPIAESIIKAIEARCDYPRRKLHILALKKYLIDTADKVSDGEYAALVEACRFAQLEFDVETEDGRDELIREAIYTSTLEEREKKSIAKKLGSIIVHTKNRYMLTATMNNHVKRACKHLWDATISIETDADKPPYIPEATIEERHFTVSRGGITLDQDKKLSQIHCSGEIHIKDNVHPFEMDLILDISYVSSTKCEHCAFKIRSYERIGKYITMNTTLSIY